MNILFLNRINNYWLEKINTLKIKYPEQNFIIPDESQSKEELIKNADAIINHEMTKEELIPAESLKIIFIPYAGVNILPFDYLKEKGIITANSHGNGKVVAERAVSMAMALAGRVIEYHDDLQKGIWHGFAVGEAAGMTWTSILDKKVTILGTGEIGRNIAKYLKVFDCFTIGIKKDQNTKIDNFDEITDNLDYAIEKSDFIFVSVPLTEETKNMIDKDRISKMKNKYLINVARGPVIDEEALYYGLKEGILAGAAIDVWYDYPEEDKKIVFPSKYPIHLFKNVVLSPHVAGHNSKAVRNGIDATIENIEKWIQTGTPVTPVNYDKKY